MKLFKLLEKDYDELTKEDKEFLEKFVRGTLLFGGAISGGLIGYGFGARRYQKKGIKAAKKAAKMAYDAGWYDSGYNLMTVVHKYNPNEFKEIMKTAQDRNFGRLYDVCWKILPDNTAILGGDK